MVMNASRREIFLTAEAYPKKEQQDAGKD